MTSSRFRQIASSASRAPTLILLLVGHALAAEGEPADSHSPWQVRAGVAWRHLGGTQVDFGYSGSAASPDFFSPNPASGDATAYADRTYDDGFVNIGAATAGSGLTTNFGYDNDSQVVADTLTYTLSGGSALDTPGQGSEGDETAAAPYLELVYFMPINDELKFGLSLNVSYADFDSSIRNTLTEYEVTTIDRYALNGIILPMGPFTGSFAGPGPVINNQPTSREQVLTPVATRTVSFESEVELYSLALGGELQWSPAESCFLNVGGGAVLNYADWQAELNAPLVSGDVRERNSDEEFLWGVYLKAGAGYRLTEALSLEAFARYDWNETLSGSAGPADFETDLSGWTLGVALGYRF